jgi:hypothetical protein
MLVLVPSGSGSGSGSGAGFGSVSGLAVGAQALMRQLAAKAMKRMLDVEISGIARRRAAHSSSPYVEPDTPRVRDRFRCKYRDALLAQNILQREKIEA